MKRWYHIVIALVVLVGLLVFLDFDFKHEETNKEKEEQAALLMPPSYPWNELKQMEILTKNAAVTLMPEPVADKPPEEWNWKLTKPLQTEAEISEIQGYIRSLKSIKTKSTVEEKVSDFTPFGLDSSKNKPIRFILTGSNNKVTEIIIGDMNPDRSSNYARFADSQKVWLIDQTLNHLGTRENDFFRRKTYFGYDNSKVDRVTIQYLQQPVIEIARSDRHWRLQKPFAAQADDNRINNFLSDIKMVRIDHYMSENAEQDAAKYGFKSPKAQISLFLNGEKEPYTIWLGNDNQPKTGFYVRKSGSNTIYQSPSYHADKLKKKLDDFIDHDLSHFLVGEINAVTIIQPKKANQELQLKDGKWSLMQAAKTSSVTTEKAEAVIRLVNELKGKQFIGRTPGKEDGLDKPELTLTLSAPPAEAATDAAKLPTRHLYRFKKQTIVKDKTKPKETSDKFFVQGGVDNFVFEMEALPYQSILDAVAQLTAAPAPNAPAKPTPKSTPTPTEAEPESELPLDE